MDFFISSPPVLRYDLNDIWGEPVRVQEQQPRSSQPRHLYTSASQPLLSQAAAEAGGYEPSHGISTSFSQPAALTTPGSGTYYKEEDDASASFLGAQSTSKVTAAQNSAAYPRLSIALTTAVLLLVGLSLCTVGILSLRHGPQIQQAQYGAQRAIGAVPGFPLRMGLCQDLHIVNQGAHVFLNIIGVLILGFSSFLQQLLTSPLFSRAFNRTNWVTSTFGNNSVGRLFRIGTTVSIFGWIGMVLTSLPAHAFVNSLVTYTRLAPGDNGWNFGVGSWPAYPTSTIANSNASYPLGNRVPVDLVQCRNSIHVPIQDTTAINPVLIVSDYNVLRNWYNHSPGDWYEGMMEHKDENPTFTATCYADLYSSKCFMSIRPEPALVVGIACVVKALIVIWLLIKDTHFTEPSISSIGDAILAVHKTEKQIGGKSLVGFSKIKTHVDPIKYKAFNMRRFSMLRVGDWFSYFYWVLSVIGAGVCFWLALGLSETSIAGMFKAGFAASGTAYFSIPDTAGLGSLGAMAAANSPQFWLSSAYFTYSSAITQIYQEYEWQKFYMRSTHIRTTIQHPFLRTEKTRWLQLPLIASAALMSIGGVMHWLVSLSVSITDVISGSTHTSTVVIAAEPLFVLVVVAGGLVLAITVFYCISLKYKMPILNNSLGVLAAAVPTGGLMPELMWAATKESAEQQARCGLMYDGEHPKADEYYW
ncbi:hypothetical protein T439DRAFT_376140 [Meredithblackwellia eburnea MCA 4105]